MLNIKLNILANISGFCFNVRCPERFCALFLHIGSQVRAFMFFKQPKLSRSDMNSTDLKFPLPEGMQQYYMSWFNLAIFNLTNL